MKLLLSPLAPIHLPELTLVTGKILGQVDGGEGQGEGASPYTAFPLSLTLSPHSHRDQIGLVTAVCARCL